MTPGLKTPMTRGLARPTPKTGLARPTAAKTASNPATRGTGGPVRSGSNLRPSASNHSLAGSGGLSRSTSAASVESLKPGTRVLVRESGLEGTVRFCGEPQFAKGVWVGVELDTESGKNNGEVKGVRYFECAPNYGLFCKPDKLVKLEAVMRPIRTPSSNTVDYETKFKLRVGARCIVNGAKEGTLKFVGLTSFARGVWAGVALDTPDGKNDGSVKGERYFTCEPAYGLFAQASKITMVGGAPSSISSASLNSLDGSRKAISPMDTALKRMASPQETPRKPSSPDVMKPDFSARNTPVSTPGLQSSLSGLMRSKSRDIDTMQKNIGDLQLRLSEVNKRNGHTPQKQSSEQYDQLKKMYEESEQERNELNEKLKAAENDRITYETRLTHVAELADKDKGELSDKLAALLHEMEAVRTAHTTERATLQDQIAALEADLTVQLEKVEEWEQQMLHSDAAAPELEMSRQQVAELSAEVTALRNARNTDETRMSELEEELAGALERCSESEVAGPLRARVSELEGQLEERRAALERIELEADERMCELQTERDALSALKSDHTTAQENLTALESEMAALRASHEALLQDSSNRDGQLAGDVSSRDQTIAELRSELARLTSESESERGRLEREVERSAGEVSRLQEQAERDVARVTELEGILSSSNSDSNEQIVTAHKKISELETALRDSERSAGEQAGQLNESLGLLREELAREKEGAAATLAELEAAKGVLSGQLEEALASAGSLEAQLREKSDEGVRLLETQEELRGQLSTLESEVARLRPVEAALASAEQSLAALNSDRETERAEHAELVRTLEANIDELEGRIATLQVQAKSEREGAEAGLRAQLDTARQEMEGLRKASEMRISELETQLTEMTVEKEAQEREVAGLRGELAKLREQLSESENQMKELAEECDAKQSDEEIENLHKQITNLSEENDLLKLSFQEKNEEFDELTAEVSTLREISETAFTELKKNEEQFTSSLRSTEMQLTEAMSKMKLLQTKINDLEEEVVRERSRANELEQRLNTPPGMSFEDVDDLSNLSGASSPPPRAPNFVPDRVFCDHCDVFDDHETQYCPIARSPGGVRYGGTKGPSGRPYCTVCEMFGHTAEECEDDMTF